MKVLLVGDKSQRNFDLNEFFIRKSSIVEHVQTVEVGYEFASLYDYDILISDFKFSGGECTWLVKKLRINKFKLPIIIVAEFTNYEDIIKCLHLGVDDYVSFPYHFEELHARAIACVRRTYNHISSEIVIGELTINISCKKVSINGATLHFTGKEYMIVEILALQTGKFVGMDSILYYLYGYNHEMTKMTVRTFLCRLNKKIGKFTNVKYLRSVQGLGYILSVPD